MLVFGDINLQNSFLQPFSEKPRTPREHTVTLNRCTIQLSYTFQRKHWTPWSARDEDSGNTSSRCN